MTYAELTTADKGALMDAKLDGCEWIARDDISDDLCGFDVKPFKNRKHGRWYARKLKHISHLDSNSLQFIQWSDTEPVNIDLALAQIAEMESATKTLRSYLVDVWKEDERALAIAMLYPASDGGWRIRTGIGHSIETYAGIEVAIAEQIKLLNSPYTEGETK